MTDNKIKDELEKLIIMGNKIYCVAIYEIKKQSLGKKEEKNINEIKNEIKDFRKKYHVWYPRAYRCVRTFSPERLEEFEELYKGKKNIKKLNSLTAGMTHFLQGFTTTQFAETNDFSGKFLNGLDEQINIIEGIKENIGDILFNLESEIHYEIFKSEIYVANELKNHKQFRASGAIAGVVIEGHLKLSCENNNIKLRKRNPSISDYNDALKNDKKIDIVMWRLIARCGDIRNYCVHSKERDPTPDEIDDIIRSAEKIISEVS